MKMGETKKKALPKALENPKIFKAVIIGGLAIILLVFLGDLLFGGKEKAAPTVTLEESDMGALEKKLEERLANILGKIDGIGKVEVMITIDGTSEYIYAEEVKRKESSDNKNGDTTEAQKSLELEGTTVIVDAASGKQALVKTVILPQVRGVVVVCENGSSAVIKQRVTDAVSKAFNISSAKICVTN